MVGWCCTLAMRFRSFTAFHGIMKTLLGTAKCTGGIGKYVGEFASMKN